MTSHMHGKSNGKARVAVNRALILLLFAISLSSCATTSQQPHAPSRIAPDPSGAVSGHWVKVRSNPPTWYPRGTRSDCPTDFRNGEWVDTGDRDGTRYFIPLHVSGGIPRETLLKEALAARGTDAHRPSVCAKSASFVKVVGNIVVGTPLTLLALYGAAASSPDGEVHGDWEPIVPFRP